MESKSGLTFYDIIEFPFIYKLWILTESIDDVISWSRSGKEIFVNPIELLSYLIDKRSFFNERTPHLFLEQLSLLGFERIPPQTSTSTTHKLCFRSQYFVRGCPDLLSVLNELNPSDKTAEESCQIINKCSRPKYSKDDRCFRKIGNLTKLEKSRILFNTELLLSEAKKKFKKSVNSKKKGDPTSCSVINPYQSVPAFPENPEYAGYYGSCSTKQIKDFFGVFLPVYKDNSMKSATFGVTAKSLIHETNWSNNEKLTMSSSLEQIGRNNFEYNIFVTLNEGNTEELDESNLYFQSNATEAEVIETDADEKAFQLEPYLNNTNRESNEGESESEELSSGEESCSSSSSVEEETMDNGDNREIDIVNEIQQPMELDIETSNELQHNLVDSTNAETKNEGVTISEFSHDQIVESDIQNLELTGHWENNDQNMIPMDLSKRDTELNDSIVNLKINDEIAIIKRKRNEKISKESDINHRNFRKKLQESHSPKDSTDILVKSEYNKITNYLEQNIDSENSELSKQLEQIFGCSDPSNFIDPNESDEQHRNNELVENSNKIWDSDDNDQSNISDRDKLINDLTNFDERINERIISNNARGESKLITEMRPTIKRNNNLPECVRQQQPNGAGFQKFFRIFENSVEALYGHKEK